MSRLICSYFRIASDGRESRKKSIGAVAAGALESLLEQVGEAGAGEGDSLLRDLLGVGGVDGIDGEWAQPGAYRFDVDGACGQLVALGRPIFFLVVAHQ